MSAETLRKAAALIRERAKAATPGPWDRGDIDRFDEGSFTVDYADVEPNVCGGIDPADAEHIASWHPDVALAVADQLDREGVAWQQVAADHPDLAGAVEDNVAKSGWLTVARAYLGGDA